MRLTSTLTLILLATLPACGPGGGSETGSDTSTSSTGTSTGTPGSTSEPTSSTTTGVTTPGEPATTTGEPGTTGEPVTSTTTGEPGTTSSSTTGGSSDTSSTTTGEPPSEACVSDDDCALHNDCCDCYGLPKGQVDPSCPADCEQPTCDSLQIDQAVCRFGVCITEKLDCDASKVVCKALPPECPDGQQPGVKDTCWSGICVPIVNCNAVPTCDLCPEGTMCVQKISKQQTWPACEPIPPECGGEIDCKCAGMAVCTGAFNICNDLEGNQLSCGCPAC